MGVSDIVHGILDVAGFFPIVGTAADLANAVFYAAEGDWGNAALSAASAVPMAGDIAGAAKVGIKGAEAAEAAVKGARAAEAAADGSKAARSTSAVTKAQKMSSFFTDLCGKAKDGAKSILDRIKKKIEEIKAKKAANKEKNCFTGDTLVVTNYGYCPIKEVQKGDDIYSRNEKTGETGLRKVKEIIRTEAHTIYHIWLDGREEIKTTAYHPVFVIDKGWVYAINLQEGNLLETLDGTAQITKIVKTRHEEPVEVYNFHVEEWETYFVSERQVYVHNCGEHNDNGNAANKVFDKKIKWTATRPKGTGQTYDVHQRNDIDWDKIRTSGDRNYIGKTNAEAAKHGLPPQLNDGNFATLHHLGQDSRGGLVEASTRYHGVGKPGQNILHSQYGRNKPNPNHRIDRNKFGVDSREYWKWREQNR